MLHRDTRRSGEVHVCARDYLSLSKVRGVSIAERSAGEVPVTQCLPSGGPARRIGSQEQTRELLCFGAGWRKRVLQLLLLVVRHALPTTPLLQKVWDAAPVACCYALWQAQRGPGRRPGVSHCICHLAEHKCVVLVLRYTLTVREEERVSPAVHLDQDTTGAPHIRRAAVRRVRPRLDVLCNLGRRTLFPVALCERLGRALLPQLLREDLRGAVAHRHGGGAVRRRGAAAVAAEREVGHLQHAVRRDQQVRRLDVKVQDVAVAEVVQRCKEVCRVRPDLLGRQHRAHRPPQLVDHLLQRAAHVLHEEEEVFYAGQRRERILVPQPVLLVRGGHGGAVVPRGARHLSEAGFEEADNVAVSHALQDAHLLHNRGRHAVLRAVGRDKNLLARDAFARLLVPQRADLAEGTLADASLVGVLREVDLHGVWRGWGDVYVRFSSLPLPPPPPADHGTNKKAVSIQQTSAMT
eukprot:Rhum_TRINITY_DN9871_c0_g1::Rhum_TRINITY_DN9871_c0_g1_i1::g.35631::m.35631